MAPSDSNNLEQHYDIAVIGAGVAGLSAAYFLAHSGQASVLVLERESQPAYHSSGRSAALYIEGYENPVVAGLTAASGNFFKQPPAGFAQAPLLHDRGGLTVAAVGEEQALGAYLQKWQPFCPNLRYIDTTEARALCPILKADQIVGAAWDPDWKSIDTHELMQGFQRGLRSQGTLLTGQEVNAIERLAEGWHIHTPKGRFQATTIVNAAGAWANQIATLAGVATAPLSPLRRTAAIVPVPDSARQWPVTHTIAGNLYFKPESPGLMVCPQDELPSEAVDAFATEMDIALGIERLQQITDLAVERVLHQWAGLRTFAPDRYPVLGRDPAEPGFFWLAGQGGFGVQTSPELGRLTASALLADAALDAQIHISRWR